MSDCRFDCTDIVFCTHGELAVDLAFDLSPYSPADTQRCRVETAALPV
jgi:hypothetical protein